MSRWIFPLLGFLLSCGVFDLQAQLSKPSSQRPIFPSSSPSAPRAQPGQTVQQVPMAQTVQPETLQPGVITAQSMELLDNTRKLGVGDRLSFRITQDREEAKPVMITDMGEVELPLVGRVKASGKTLKQLAYDVKQLMDQEYYYNSTVLIGLDQSSRFRGRIYVIGAVLGVGPQDIPSDEVFTVSKAILRAGGFGDFANQRKVKLVRKGGPGGENSEGKKDEVIVDCKKIYQGEPDAVDPVLQADDLIVVPQRLINF